MKLDELETKFARRLVIRLGRNPELASDVLERLTKARRKAVALLGKQAATSHSSVAMLVEKKGRGLAVRALLGLLTLLTVTLALQNAKVDIKSDKAIIDYHVEAESGPHWLRQ